MNLGDLLRGLFLIVVCFGGGCVVGYLWRGDQWVEEPFCWKCGQIRRGENK